MQIQVSVDKNRHLCIAGDRSASSESNSWKIIRQERPTGTLQRKFELPEDANISHLSAKLAEGLLTITVAKLDV